MISPRLSDLSQDLLIHQYQLSGNPSTELIIPDGLEAVVVKEGMVSNPFRPGDYISIQTQRSLLAYSSGQVGGIYICRKQMIKTIRWGCGDIAMYNGKVLGVNGLLLLYTSNSRLLVANFALGELQLDEESIQNRIELRLVKAIRQGLYQVTSSDKIETSPLSPEMLLALLSNSLKLSLLEVGLGVKRLIIDDVLIQ